MVGKFSCETLNPFHPPDWAALENVDGFGDFPGVLRGSSEACADLPGLELDLDAFAGSTEPDSSVTCSGVCDDATLAVSYGDGPVGGVCGAVLMTCRDMPNRGGSAA